MNKKSSTDDLMNRLKKSLEGSPLSAHQRQKEKTVVEPVNSAENLLVSGRSIVRPTPVREGDLSPKTNPSVVESTTPKHTPAELDSIVEKIIAIGKSVAPEPQTFKGRAKSESPAQSAVAPTGVVSYQRAQTTAQRAQGTWKSATIGLYAEDYQKIREVMDFVQRQTGEMLNLSRVIKIALRSLKIDADILVANEQVRGSDRRASRY